MRAATIAHAAFEESQNALRNYCSRLIKRHGLDPAKFAISPDLNWIVEVPMDKLQAALQATAEQSAKNAEGATETVPEAPVEAPAAA